MKIKSVLNQNLFIDYDILYDMGDNIFRSMARADEMLQELSGLMGRAEALVFRAPEEVRHALLQNWCAKVKGEIRGIDLSAYGLKASRSLYALADQSQSVDREVAENLLDKKEVMRFLRHEVDGLTQMAAFRNHHYRSNTLLKGVMGKSENSIENPWNPIESLSEMRKIYERETFDVTGKPFSATYQAAIFSGVSLDTNGVPIINNAIDAENYMKIMRLSLYGKENQEVVIYKDGLKIVYYACGTTFEEAVDKQAALTGASTAKYEKNKYEDRRAAIIDNMLTYTHMSGSEIYQFVNLSQAGIISEDKAAQMLAGKGVLDGKEQVFMEASTASEEYSVSELYLINHAIHETGKGTSELAVGVDYTPDGGGKTKKVYNMYGIRATDDDPITSGAAWAYEKKWFSVDEAIIGGAAFIRENYIKNEQKTLYDMRWNPENPATHQYATDVGWALNQVRKEELSDLYESYRGELELRIPVYSAEVEEGINE